MIKITIAAIQKLEVNILDDRLNLLLQVGSVFPYQLNKYVDCHYVQLFLSTQTILQQGIE